MVSVNGKSRNGERSWAIIDITRMRQKNIGVWGTNHGSSNEALFAVQFLSCVQLFVTSWTASHQAPGASQTHVLWVGDAI